MPLCLIVGLPQIVRRRAPKFRLRRENWTFDTIDSHGDYIDLEQIWDRVLRRAAENDTGTHIFSFVAARRDREHFEPTAFMKHRLVWLTDADQQLIYGRRFEERMNVLLEFEERWLQAISPTSERDALMLPDIAFEARTPLDGVWKRSARLAFGADDTIDRVARELSRFRSDYYTVGSELRGCWVDNARRVFQIPEKRLWHANDVPAAHKWKFTWEVPHGFHYDVRDERARSFNVLDHNRISRRYNDYVNIDTHNHHRGKSA